MPALPVIANTYRVTLNWSAENGVSAVNVMHFYSDTGNASDLADDIAANMASPMFDALPTTQELTSLDIIALDTNSATQIFPLNGSCHGGGAAAPSPASAAVVSLRTSQRGPRGRGRLFVGGVAEDNMANGVLDGTCQTTMNAAWATFLDDMVGVGRPVVVASYVHTDQHAVLTATADTLLGTQRRRQDQLR